MDKNSKKENIELIKKQKNKFAKEFIDAVTNQSIEKCKKLIIPFDEYVILVDDKEMTADMYDEALTKQCVNFFIEKKDFFNEHMARLEIEKIDSATIYNLGDKHEIIDNFFYSPIDSLSITMENKVLENDDISSLGFQIDNPVVINSKIRINNFLFTKTYESIYKHVRVKKLHKKFGFKELTLDNFLEIMKNSPFDISTLLDECYTLSEYNWFIYDGNLVMTSEEFNTLDSDSNFLITGNLTIDGVLNLNDHTLFVLKNLKAKDIFIDSSICYIQETAYFNDVLMIEPAADDEPIRINNTEGKFVLNGARFIELGISEDKVTTFFDYANEKHFGNVQNLLKDRFIELDEYNEINIEREDILEAILNNESIFK